MTDLSTISPERVCEAGQAWPMGARGLVWGGRRGVNFAVFSRHATALWVCLFEASGEQETDRLALVCTNGIWHGFVEGLEAGQLYGLRAAGPYQPGLGQRFNPAKLLLDPFARDLVGDTQKLSLEFDYLRPLPEHSGILDAQADPADNAPRMPKARVLDWDAELRAGAAITPGPQVLLEKMVLYEAHVKGLTQRHPGVPEALRGTYAGLVSAPLLAHYQRLGITTLCLLPVHHFISEAHLLKKGLPNYWGYNTLGYFMPEPLYASGQWGDARTEFRHMVEQLHSHGFEVVLDVVFNHSAESDTLGPTLSWRGLDNASWYALDEAGRYLNFSACGNSFNLNQPWSVQMVMDSLRWWVQAFGVDGFRFDLATVLGRDAQAEHRFQMSAALLTAIAQDPILARVKLVSEPWDMGPDGYQLGKFPPGWHEWNDRFRDGCRAFWLGFGGPRGELARRLTGSNDYFDHDGRSPLSSINLITAHDGMTLADLTAYRHKHNQRNGEDNRDGHDQNLSANGGVEGPSNEATVLAVRGQWRRALLVTLFCAQGVPQLLAGDELGHSQGGNNNAYCQDNETTWLDWAGADQALCDFVAGLVHMRKAHAAWRHAHWFSDPGAEMAWCNSQGQPLSATEWDDTQCRSLGCLIEVARVGLLPSHAATERWLLVFHAHDTPLLWTLPGGGWRLVLDSSAALVLPQAQWHLAPLCFERVTVAPRSVLGLVQPFVSVRPVP